MSTQQDICTSFLEDPSQQVHDLPSSGHPGITASIQLLSNKFWWSTLRTDVIAFIKNCVTCNTYKSSKPMPAGLLQTLPVAQRPWSHIAMYFITDLPNSKGNTTILMVIDHFSMSCRVICLPKLPTALETAEVLCSYVFCFYGLPDYIVSDRGPQFTSRVWTTFKFLNVNISLIVTRGHHHPSIDFSLRNSISHHPVPGLWLLVHLMLVYGTT